MPVEVPKKKQTLLPLLVVLFAISYGLMTVLIIEQGSAIQSQRNTIKVLLRDSTELWAAKGKAIGDKQNALNQKHAQSRSSQSPSTQAQAPSTPAAPHSQGKAGKAAKQAPPPEPASDLIDQRRALHTI